ncbi:uncharacterized protein LOC129002905 [Macrosteles quadrilineatus]|uniref:uncharacterized protein LOC129002905 n=1 Tax=Macrosteles quadrilineatus TaxID=74068 RepID=UPI0023E349C7|nr:uncharacterized protein LOC129002905 [Macrosteles quadrilineatus]
MLVLSFGYVFVFVCLVPRYRYVLAGNDLEGNVLGSEDSVREVLVVIPSRDRGIAKPSNHVIKSAEEAEFVVKCTEYEADSPRALVYSPHGILLDTLTLAPQADACEETKLTKYIVPQGSKKKERNFYVKIIYLWSGKNPRCVERTYYVNKKPLYAKVESLDYPRVDCPKDVEQFVKSFDRPIKAGGIVMVGPMETTNDMEFSGDVQYQHTTNVEIRKDFEDKSFWLTCNEGFIQSENSDEKKDVTFGLISHENHPDFIIDKLQLRSCNKNGININRKRLLDVVIFKLVFKKSDGLCYCRKIYLFPSSHYYYYEKSVVFRELPFEIACPKSFEGDIHLNAADPWYLRWFTKTVKFEGNFKFTLPS